MKMLATILYCALFMLGLASWSRGIIPGWFCFLWCLVWVVAWCDDVALDGFVQRWLDNRIIQKKRAKSFEKIV